MKKNIVHLLPPRSTGILASFSDVARAIVYADLHGLDRGFGIQDLRPIDDEGQIRDRPLLAAHTIREALIPHWVRMQFDRMIAGEIGYIPRDVALGLAVPSSLFAQRALEAAGVEGWHAVMGVFNDPSPYPVPLKHHTQKPVPHAWLQHDGGMVMDLSRRVFQRSPVTVLLPDTDGAERFTMQRLITSKKSEAISAGWMEQSGEALIARLLEIDMTQALPQIATTEPEMAM